MTIYIKLSPFGSTFKDYENGMKPAAYDWPENTFLQGGTGGIVIGVEKSYRTAFVEAFLPDTFIRGEGETVEEAETKAWEKYIERKNCDQHEYIPKGYTNGAGFCKKCNDFKSKCFTGEDLNQYCIICNEPTVYGQVAVKNTNDEWEKQWSCEKHIEELGDIEYNYLLGKSELTDNERLTLNRYLFLRGEDD
jgi:hypothetical protein